MLPPVLEMPSVTAKVRNGISLDRGPLCLNLGGVGEGFRDGGIPGFLTVDLREGADIQADCSDLSFAKDKSVDQIYASNILEHFPHADTVKVLSEWCRVLKPGGKLWLSVPDIEASLRLYSKFGLQPWVVYLLWGDQKHPLNYHYINFDLPLIQKCAYEAGFSDSKRLDSLPFGVNDASEIIDSAERKPISLNLEITK